VSLHYLAIKQYSEPDSQLVRHTYVRHIAAAKQDIVPCIADIEANSSSLRLKLNADKSELIVLGTRQQLSKISTSERDLQLPGGVLRSTSSVKNLGVYLDTTMTQDDPGMPGCQVRQFVLPPAASHPADETIRR